MMLKHIKLAIIGSTLCLSPWAGANDLVSDTEHNCHIQGCLVKCAYKEGHWDTVGTAKKIKEKIYSSGITELMLDQGLNKSQTIIMGGDGYICSIENEFN